MSEKMTSQDKLSEFKSVPYNKPLFPFLQVCLHTIVIFANLQVFGAKTQKCAESQIRSTHK
jgi:hypothetical protein